jgi:S1-C subfamily serine protease
MGTESAKGVLTDMEQAENALGNLSAALAAAVAQVAPSVVRVDDGSRFTATGILWSEDGVIVTTSHGVERDEEISIVLHDGSRHAATLLGRDMDSDIAVLRVAGSGLSAIGRQEDEAAVRVGNLAIAVGQPGDGGLTATLGLVSRKYETETDGTAEYIVNTDAILYPGVSGGPLVDANGKMIGLLNRMFGQGMGVALGTPLVARVVNTLLTHGKMPRGYLGIRTQLVALPDNLRAGLAIAQERGLLIANVGAGSPADTAGLLLGDTLLKIDGSAVEDVEDLRRHLRAGQTVTLTVLRGGTLTELTATVGVEKD